MANQNSKSKNKKNTTKAGTNSKKVTSNKDVKKDTKVVAKSENKKVEAKKVNNKKVEAKKDVKKEEPEIIESENNQYENILYLARKNYFNELNSKVLLEEISFLLKSNPENIQKIKNFINEL